MGRTARWFMSLGLLPAVLAVGLGMACSSSSKESPSATKTGAPVAGTPASTGQGEQLTAKLAEYTIQLPNAPSKAGSVTFNVKNIGSTKHELVVLKTDLTSTTLPTKADGSANEDAPDLANVGETGDMAAGDSKPLTVDLQPGHYVLICNIVQTTNGQTVSHYQKRMVTEFTVGP